MTEAQIARAAHLKGRLKRLRRELNELVHIAAALEDDLALETLEREEHDADEDKSPAVAQAH